MSTPRRPIPGADNNAWGTILNEYLAVEHAADGTHIADYATQSDVADAVGAIGELEIAGDWDVNTRLRMLPAVLVIHDDKLWGSRSATDAGDEPGVSGKWAELPTTVDTEHRALTDDVHGIPAQMPAGALLRRGASGWEPDDRINRFSLAPLRITVSETYQFDTDPQPIGMLADGRLYGRISNALYVSDDSGLNWTLVQSNSISSPGIIRDLADGEILLGNPGTLHRSSGWASNPETATFSSVLTSSASGSFLRRTIDTGSDGVVLVTEYGPKDSSIADRARKVWLSTNNAQTFTEVFDLRDEYPDPDPFDNAHMHGCGYDEWNQRLWIAHGDAGYRGIRYAPLNDPTNWTLLSEDQPTTLTPTEFGVVVGTDNTPNGVWIIRPDLTLDKTAYRIVDHALTSGGLSHVAQNAHRGLDGLVYVSFGLALSEGRGIIAASDGAQAWEVWRDSEPGRGIFHVHGPDNNGKLTGRFEPGIEPNDLVLRADAPRVGSRESRDSGYVLGGTANERGTAIGPSAFVQEAGGLAAGRNANAKGVAAIAIGQDADADGAQSLAIGFDSASDGSGATAIGRDANAQGTDSLAFGRAAAATQSRTVAVGRDASAAGLESTAVGYNASSAGTGDVAIGGSSSANNSSVAVGRNTEANSLWTTAVGFGAKATDNQATAFGRDAQAIREAVALGPDTRASHQGSVAIGYESETTATAQVMVGPRDIEITDDGRGLILQSPDKSRWRVTIDNDGVLQTTKLL
jgi:hypothetical protein